MDSTVLLVIVLTLAAVPAVASLAYRAGRRAGGRKTMPWRPIFQLVDHRTRCLGQDGASVQAELGVPFALPPAAWRELLAVQRPLNTPRLLAPRAALLR